MPVQAGARRTGAALVLALLAGLPACSADRPAAVDTAKQLASALSSLDVADVPLTGPTAARAGDELTAAVAGMGGLTPAVRVRSTEEGEDENTARAVLTWTWDLDDSDDDWTYDTTAKLAYQEEDEAWTVAWAPTLVEPGLQAGERLVLRRTPAERGDVLGADGVQLVTERPVLRVGIDKTKVPPAQAVSSARALAGLLDVEAAAYERRVAAAGPKAFIEALVVRADGSTPLDQAALRAVPGAVQLPDTRSLAPTREFARPVLGTVGDATAEVVAASQGRLRAGDVVGLSGLQKSEDARLRGRAGLVVQAAPPAAGEPRELFRRDPEAGQPLATTLDLDLQLLAERLLTPVEPASALVAVRPSSGDLLAVASGPGGKGLSTATVGTYAPGSTFKVVTSLGLLRKGLDERSPVACTPTVAVDGRVFSNYGDYPRSALGEIPLRTAVAQSCNTALISQREKLSSAELAQAAAAVGLGSDADAGFPWFSGSVPADAAGTGHAAAIIGQGRVQVSPLAMALVAASLGRGAPVAPRLLADRQPKAAPPMGVTPPEAEQVRALMRAVVTEGSASFLSDVPGAPVAAKTGTAEYGQATPPRTHAWMIALQGDLAVAVFVEDGVSGSKTAGPLLEAFLRAAPAR